MARIVGGSPLGELSGKMGGLVFARNKGGPYVRQYVIPVNPNTVAQVNARAKFASSSANWHDLDANQKSNWQNYAENIFSPLNSSNVGQFSGINAFTSLQNVVANANSRNLSINPLAFGDYVIEMDGLGVDVTTDTTFIVSEIPPDLPNTGTLQTLGGIENVQLAIDVASINEAGSWNVTFNLVGITQELLGPTPSSFNLGEEGLKNSVGEHVGISCFMSESVVQLGDFVRNPYYINLGTTAPITATFAGLSGEQLTIRAQPTSLSRLDYQKFPSIGSKVRLTFVMVDRFGQRKVIGSDQVNVSSAP